MGRLQDKIAIVTGGAKGIGKAYVRALAGEGAHVVIADIADGAEYAKKLNGELKQNRVINITTDVSDEASVKSLVEQTLAKFSHLDIIVNNAALFAILQMEKVADIDVETWDRVMGVNVRGPFLLAKYASPHMIAQKSGKIINIGSGLAHKGRPDFLHYVTSKGAITSFTRALARELGAHNICVNTLAPGLVMSESVLENSHHIDDYAGNIVNTRSIKRESVPEDLIGALTFLASSDSDFITGQTLAVDGGAINT